LKLSVFDCFERRGCEMGIVSFAKSKVSLMKYINITLHRHVRKILSDPNSAKKGDVSLEDVNLELSPISYFQSTPGNKKSWIVED